MLKDGDFNKLNGDNVRWDDDASYRSMLSFTMAVGDFLDNIGDMEFINTLPMNIPTNKQPYPGEPSDGDIPFIPVCASNMDLDL